MMISFALCSKSPYEEVLSPICSSLQKDKFNFSCKKSLKMLIIGASIPYPTQSDTEKRNFHILEILNALGHSLHLMMFTNSSKTPSTEDSKLLKELNLNVMPSHIFEGRGKKAIQTFIEKLITIKPDYLFYFLEKDFVLPLGQVIKIARTTIPDAHQLLLSNEIHSYKELQNAELIKAAKAYKRLARKANRFKDAEKEIYKLVDMIITVTASDKLRVLQADTTGLLGKYKKVATVMHSVSAWDLPPANRPIRGYNERKDLVFVGDGDNPANYDAMEWWVNVIAKEVNNGIPGVKLYVIGKAWDEFQKTNPMYKTYVIFFGTRNPLERTKILDAVRVFVSPIKASSGIRSESILALTHGLPLVTTPAGAPGLCAVCDDVTLQSPYDPFNLKSSAKSQIPFLIGRDMWDVVLQVKNFYYYEKIWIDFARNSSSHAIQWFDLQRAALELEDVLTQLDSLPNIDSFTKEVVMAEKEEREKFKKIRDLDV